MSHLQPPDTPSERPSRASSVACSARRARVEDAEDEDDHRETNRQRTHSPPQHDSHHHFHPDMHAHAEEQRQERERQHAQPTQLPPANRPQLYNRISLTFDLMPGFGPPPEQHNISMPAQAAARGMPFIIFIPSVEFRISLVVPGASQDGAPIAQDPILPRDDAPAANPNAPTANPDAPQANTVDFAAFFQRLRESMGLWVGFGGSDMEEPDDPGRAKRLLSGLEEVPEGLIKRMELVGREQGESVVCAICFESLLDCESASFADSPRPSEPIRMDVDPQPGEPLPPAPSSPDVPAQDESDKSLDRKVVVLPCAHAFHASCLRPWFTRPHRTTCPSCRFDIDPDSLTYTPPVRPPRTSRNQPPQTTPAVPTADGTQAPTSPEATVQETVPLARDGQAVPTPDPSHAASANAAPQPQPQAAARTAQNLPFGLVLDFNMIIPGLPPLRARTQGQPQTTPTGEAGDPPQFGPPPPPGPSLGTPPNWERFMDDAQFERLLFGGPAPTAAGVATSIPGAQSQPTQSATTQPGGAPLSNTTRGPLQSRVVFHSFSIPITGRDRTPTVPPQTGQAGTGQPAAATALPSFEEFMNLVNLPVPPAFQPPPQPQQGTQQPAPETRVPPAGDTSAPETQAPGHPPHNAQDPQGLDAMVGDLASTLLGALFAGGPLTQTTGAHVHNPPPPPGPIPFNIPLNTQQRGPRPPVPEKRQWTPPPPPGLTLREQVEKKERELGLRCSDISCGLGPSDEDPTPVVDPRTIRQVAIRPRKGKGPEHDRVCAHTFHPACLVSAERVAGWSGADQKKDVDGEQEEVEVSCPVCRAVGCISREDWDEGACALA